MTADVRGTDGLTSGEGDVMDSLVDATDSYMELPVEHPNEQAEFFASVHRLQDLLAVRIARRSFPDGWARFDNGKLVD